MDAPGIFHQRVFSGLIFLFGVNIGVEKIADRLNALASQALDAHDRTGRAANMQQRLLHKLFLSALLGHLWVAAPLFRSAKPTLTVLKLELFSAAFIKSERGLFLLCLLGCLQQKGIDGRQLFIALAHLFGQLPGKKLRELRRLGCESEIAAVQPLSRIFWLLCKTGPLESLPMQSKQALPLKSRKRT